MHLYTIFGSSLWFQLYVHSLLAHSSEYNIILACFASFRYVTRRYSLDKIIHVLAMFKAHKCYSIYLLNRWSGKTTYRETKRATRGSGQQKQQCWQKKVHTNWTRALLFRWIGVNSMFLTDVLASLSVFAFVSPIPLPSLCPPPPPLRFLAVLFPFLVFSASCETIENAAANIRYYVFTIDKLYIGSRLHGDCVYVRACAYACVRIKMYLDKYTYKFAFTSVENHKLNSKWFQCYSQINPIKSAFCASSFPHTLFPRLLSTRWICAVCISTATTISALNSAHIQ